MSKFEIHVCLKLRCIFAKKWWNREKSAICLMRGIRKSWGKRKKRRESQWTMHNRWSRIATKYFKLEAFSSFRTDSTLPLLLGSDLQICCIVWIFLDVFPSLSVCGISNFTKNFRWIQLFLVEWHECILPLLLQTCHLVFYGLIYMVNSLNVDVLVSANLMPTNAEQNLRFLYYDRRWKCIAIFFCFCL